MLSFRSESYDSLPTDNGKLFAPGDHDLRHGRLRTSADRRGGSDAAEGPERTAFGSGFRSGWRRSPLVIRPEGRPSANAGQGASFWRNCKSVGTARGEWGRTSPKLNVVRFVFLPLTRRGGATPPQGPTQTVRWVPTFSLRGRRSPSHDDRLRRP
jgi:hypothetical protein